MLNVLQSYHEFCADQRVLRLMAGYFAWQARLPDAAFGAGYWPALRMGDNLESIYWLYNRTADPSLLHLARRVHDNMADWVSGIPNWHNVNIAQGFREPAHYYLQSGNPQHLAAVERNYRLVMQRYGQVPGGGFGGDENCRPGFGDPRQGIETCGIVELMHSFELLSTISGDPIWADRCEEIAFNTFPAALTPDLKALRYITCPNLVQADRGNKSPGLENSGPLLSYSPFEVYRCCQHNVSHGWPYYAEHLWYATADGGLCASLYAACQVTAEVGDDGTVVRIVQDTDYPFSDSVRLTIVTARPVRFPLYLRLPRWSGNPTVSIDGRPAAEGEPLTYLKIERLWSSGDTVTLQLPMSLQVRRWAANQNAVSIDYGPLTFSLKIGERWERSGGTDEWPEWEVFPTTPWNYGLALDDRDPTRSLELMRGSAPLAPNPFTHENAPLELRALARRLPAWTLDHRGLVGPLQPSPARSEEPLEQVTLIPMGAARLRLSAFPTIGQGPDAQEWTP
jgi:DUF1680 family protein